MIARRALRDVEGALARQPAVLLLGPRQAGKTTLALEVARRQDALYLDLERSADRRRLGDPARFLEVHDERLVILDHIRRGGELFRPLRAAIDQRRRRRGGNGRVLVVGFAAFSRMRQQHSLAGRLGRVDLAPLDILEVEETEEALERLWLRGGLPAAFLEPDDLESFRWRRELLLACCEGEARQLGSRSSASAVEDLLAMLAERQGKPLNAADLAGALPMAATTVRRTIRLFVDLHLVRELRPYYRSLGRRLAKAPRTYIRDSGLQHSLLGIRDAAALRSHPLLRKSWEGFVIETLLAVAPFGTRPFWYRSGGGARLDLILEIPGRPASWAIQISHDQAPRVPRGVIAAVRDIGAERAFVIAPGDERSPLREGVERIGLRELAGVVADA